MAAIYGNIIKELIVQSRLNGQLLNEVNNKLHDNDLNFADVREHHIKRVEQEYQNLHLDRIYDYFDGTNLINSLFSTVVVPIEYLKGRFKRQFNNAGTYKKYDDYFRNINPIAYGECVRIISNLNMVNTFSQDRDNVNVYVFFQRLRNALSHSGNGQIHFFPNENGQDITHLYFYDENFPDDFGRQKLFLVKIHILNELPQLVTAFDNIILSILNTNNLPYDLNHIRDNIENCTGIDISDWSDE